MRRIEYNRSSVMPRRKELRKNQTDAELQLWQEVRGNRLEGCKFYRQYSVGPYILDFYCPKARLAIELDGSQHVENRDYDRQRSLFLNGHDITVLRFWNNEVFNNLEGVLLKVCSELRQ